MELPTLLPGKRYLLIFDTGRKDWGILDSLFLSRLKSGLKEKGLILDRVSTYSGGSSTTAPENFTWHVSMTVHVDPDFRQINKAGVSPAVIIAVLALVLGIIGLGTISLVEVKEIVQEIGPVATTGISIGLMLALAAGAYFIFKRY